MIYSGLDDIAKAKAIAGKVIQEVTYLWLLFLILISRKGIEFLFGRNVQIQVSSMQYHFGSVFWEVALWFYGAVCTSIFDIYSVWMKNLEGKRETKNEG